MTYSLKMKLEKLRQMQPVFFNPYLKNIKPLPDIYAELMLEIINDFEQEMYELKIWSNR